MNLSIKFGKNMKKIFILISVILLFKPYSVYSMDYDKLEIICNNKGLTVDKKEYWECMDEQRKLKNTYNPNTKIKISDNNSNTSSKIEVIDHHLLTNIQ
jgi:alanyl-tRNA synthetase